MTDEEKKQSDKAKLFIAQHKALLIQIFADPAMYIADARPVSLFMAGSPAQERQRFPKG